MALVSVRLAILLLILTGWDLSAQTFQELLKGGLLALQRNDLVSAEANLRSAAEMEPANARVWVALAQTLWKRNEVDKAETAAQKAWELAGVDSAVLRSLVIYYSESGQAGKAAEAQERAVAQYFDAAQPLLRTQKFAEAIALLKSAPPSIVKSAQVQLALGVAYYGLRRFDESAAALLSVIALDPAIKQPYIFLGKMLEQVPPRLDEITRVFIAYEGNNPSDFEGHLLHAKVLNARAIEPETARKLLDKAIEKNPGSAEAHFELGSLLDGMQRFPEAAAEFERAAALDPSDAATHYRLSRLYQRMNKPEAATAEREQHRKMVTAQNIAR